MAVQAKDADQDNNIDETHGDLQLNKQMSNPLKENLVIISTKSQHHKDQDKQNDGEIDDVDKPPSAMSEVVVAAVR